MNTWARNAASTPWSAILLCIVWTQTHLSHSLILCWQFYWADCKRGWWLIAECRGERWTECRKGQTGCWWSSNSSNSLLCSGPIINLGNILHARRWFRSLNELVMRVCNGTIQTESERLCSYIIAVLKPPPTLPVLSGCGDHKKKNLLHDYKFLCLWQNSLTLTGKVWYTNCHNNIWSLASLPVCFLWCWAWGTGSLL